METLPANDFIAPVGSLLTEQREAQVFWQLRARTVKSAVHRMLTTARLRLSLVVILSLFFWIGLYSLFYKGFEFLSGPGISTDIVPPLFNTFFLALMVMLVFSSGIILHNSLFCSPETVFLLTTPVRAQRIYMHKFQEAVVFSSWGFILLGSPTLVAYGVSSGAPWYYYALLLPFIIAFVHIPAAIGGILCLLIVNRLPTIRRHLLFGAILAVIIVAACVAWGIFSNTEGKLMSAEWFQQVFSRLRFAEQRMLPSWWLSVGLLEGTRQVYLSQPGDQPWSESLLFLTLLISNALFFSQVGRWIAGRQYRASYSQLYGERPARRRTTTWWVDAVLSNRLPLPQQMRLLLVKDFRLFRRDPVQWSQFLIFFGLLGFYFLNVRKFTYNASYSTTIGFLNLAVVGLILSTFTTRFIFPMISLEGRQLWILGLLPIRRDTILWSKFVFAAIGSVVPCTMLILISDLMLEIPWNFILLHQLSCVVLCLGLSAIAVGLGARMPDLAERSPSKIAAGFGGTLNLVISAGFIAVVVLLTALPVHLLVASQQETFPLPINESLFIFLGSSLGVATGAMLTVAVGIVAVFCPLWMGLRAFRKLEF